MKGGGIPLVCCWCYTNSFPFFIFHVYLSSWNYQQSRKACSVQLICVNYTLFGLDTFIVCGTWQQLVAWIVGWHLQYDFILTELPAVNITTLLIEHNLLAICAILKPIN